MYSKLIGVDAEFFSGVVEQLWTTHRQFPDRKTTVKMTPLHRLSAHNSKIVDGFILNRTILNVNGPKKISNAKINCFNCSLKKMSSPYDPSVVHAESIELDNKRKEIESRNTIEALDRFLLDGVNVIFCTGTIDQFCMSHIHEGGAMMVDQVQKSDMNEIVRMTNCSKTFTELSSYVSGDVGIGQAEEISQQNLCGANTRESIVIKSNVNR